MPLRVMEIDRRKLISTARGKLAAYIDALWVGRAASAAPLVAIYTERLAMASRLWALLEHRDIVPLRDFVRQENRVFPRDFLATDAGRAARAAFNLFARAVSELESYKTSGGSFPDGPEEAVGNQLSSVTFVLNYVRLGFDGHDFTVLCPITVHGPEGYIRTCESGFRDRLCEPIGETVRSVSVTDTMMTIAFDRHRIELSLTPSENEPGPEALIFSNPDGRVLVYHWAITDEGADERAS